MSGLLDRAAAAARLGIHPDSITRYRNSPEVYAFPEPDGQLGRSPGWYAQTIDDWQAARPGRTGRPRKEAQR
jgi:predicted DNA-binding transcriptional regulator AlpA